MDPANIPPLLLTAALLVGGGRQPAGATSRLQAAQPSGQEVYQTRCASCHDQPQPQAPPRAALQGMSAARILRTLDFGVMMSIAYTMRRSEREAVAAYLGTKGDEPGPPASAFCPNDRTIMAAPSKPRWTGWSVTPANTRFQSAEGAGLSAEDLGRLELAWAFGFQGDITAFAAPTLVDGTLFVGSAGGAVQGIDARTGCLHWVFRANGPVRSALVVADAGPRRTLVFGDQIGWFYALEARSGKLLWKRRVEAHEATRLTGSPAVHDGVVFVPAASWEETRAIAPEYPCCTFRGSVTALRVGDGSQVWKTYLVGPPRKTGVTSAGTETFGPSGAPVWSTPTVAAARGALYVTTGDNYSHPATPTSDAVVALHLKTGRILWSRQTTPNDVYNSSCGGRGANCPDDHGPDHDYGAAPMLVRTAAGKDLLVAGQKSGMVYALDPDQEGKVLWQARVGHGGTNGGVQWGMATDGRNVYAAVSDLARLPGAGPSASPLGNASFDPVRGGGLTALRLETGDKVWFAPGRPCDPPRPGCSPAQPGAVTAIPGAVLSGSVDGYLRAFSTDDGRLLWEVDTVKPYQTVNGAPGMGGSLDGAGAIVAGGMVFVNSGYPRNGGMPGNVLLAFGLRGAGR
jgi:polyvinyl alcohol dehydrogenase (cytochrome)